jgi:hypothetical protein
LTPCRVTNDVTPVAQQREDASSPGTAGRPRRAVPTRVPRPSQAWLPLPPRAGGDAARWLAFASGRRA